MVDMYQRASFSIEGVATNTIVQLDNNANFNAKNLITENCTVKVEGRSSAIVNVSKSLLIDAIDNSEVDIYGNPKIEVNQFLGSSKLLKKEQ